MKCIAKGEEAKRVSDVEAFELVKKGWNFIKKSIYKDTKAAIRYTKEAVAKESKEKVVRTEQRSEKSRAAKEVNKSDKVERVKKEVKVESAGEVMEDVVSSKPKNEGLAKYKAKKNKKTGKK